MPHPRLKHCWCIAVFSRGPGDFAVTPTALEASEVTHIISQCSSLWLHPRHSFSSCASGLFSLPSAVQQASPLELNFSFSYIRSSESWKPLSLLVGRPLDSDWNYPHWSDSLFFRVYILLVLGLHNYISNSLW